MNLKNQNLNEDGTYRLKNQPAEEKKEEKKPRRRGKKNG